MKDLALKELWGYDTRELMETAANLGSNSTLNVRVPNAAEADRKGKAHIRKKNSKEIKGTIVMPGKRAPVGGQTIKLNGFGVLAGKWYVDHVDHSFSDGWQASASVHKVAE